MQCKVMNIHLSGEFAGGEDALNAFLKTVKPKRMSTSLVTTGNPFWSVLVFYEEDTAEQTPSKSGDFGRPSAADGAKNEEFPELTEAQKKTYETLRRWRNAQADKEGIKPYAIAHNAWLALIAKANPKTKADLQQVSGLGEKRVERYGDGILAALWPTKERKAG